MRHGMSGDVRYMVSRYGPLIDFLVTARRLGLVDNLTIRGSDGERIEKYKPSIVKRLCRALVQRIRAARKETDSRY